ncbi:helix-turn-helix domain-containing protein (plasmid) [Streptomyces sp. NBC_01471]|uniref:helix-turn-helix domain-containing protein n=1 Tax=Streptomyces sp. NBC_01471 TaxID=2903879 RepID=UPI00324E9F56
MSGSRVVSSMVPSGWCGLFLRSARSIRGCLAQVTGLPRPTVHRLLGQLRRSGAVEWADGHWALSASLMGLARHVEPLAGLRETSSKVIQQRLREQTGAAVSLVVPPEGSFVALEMVPGRDALPIAARSGAQRWS